MSRIQSIFKRKALIAYITAGDPTPERTPELVAALERGGADLIELGVPFSDPIADGPVIQRGAERALKAGTTVKKVLNIARQIREKSQIPLLLFTYLNPVMRYGLDALARDAKAAGIDGCLLTDVSVEEADPYVKAMRAAGLDTVFLAAPTSTPARLKLVAEYSSGFVYLVSRTGVTGEQASLIECRCAAGEPDARGHQAAARGRIRHLDTGTSSRGRADCRRRSGRQRLRAADRTGRRSRSLRPLSAPGDGPMTREDAMAILRKYREQIDSIDLELLELLNRRTRVVEEIGQVKEAVHLPIYEPKREEDVFRNVVEHNHGPLAADALKRIFERIIDEMRSLQRMRRESGDKQC